MTTSNEHNTAHAVPAVIECPISIGGSGSELASVTPDGDATIHWTAVEQAAKEGNHFLSAMAKLMIAARDVGRAPAPAVAQGEPVAWKYELAVRIDADGRGSGWCWHLTDYKPSVPDGMIRNLRPLTYADAAPAVTQTVYLVENRTCLLAYASREDADKAVASMTVPAPEAGSESKIVIDVGPGGSGGGPAEAAPPATEQTAPAPAQEAAINYHPGTWYEVKSRDELEAFFLSRLPAIREAAHEHGYAIGLHGSLRRDMDVIAVPWRDGASDKDKLAHAIATAAVGMTRNGGYEWETKPAGRVATSLPCCWTPWHGEAGSGHIDLSVMTAPAVPQGWVEQMLTDARHVFDAGGPETPQETRDVIEYVASWIAAYYNKLAVAQPASDQAVPSGEVVAWMVYGNYTRQPFGMLSSAEAYMRGLLKSDPDGGYHIRPLRYATPAPAQDEPLGHFRVEPFGWTDCAKDDEGAIALYERPQEVGLMDEEIEAIAKKHMSTVGDHWCNEDAIRERHAEDFARAIIAALRAKGGKRV